MTFVNQVAKVIFDGIILDVPQEMGAPQPHHLQGSPYDNLIELAGRICYDSLKEKRSRASADYHKHIVEVNHGSVQEHATFTVLIPYEFYKESFLVKCNILSSLLNRPWVYTREVANGIRITTNIRGVREWDRWNKSDMSQWISKELKAIAKKISPLAMFDFDGLENSILSLVKPETEEEIWLSLYLGNISRGLTHELVRHGDWSAISQRSTRYVDESECDYAWHPLIKKLDEEGVNLEDLNNFQLQSQEIYKKYQKILQEYLEKNNFDKFTAKKQSRGAARGILGNALSTELIFSASVSQWKAILLQRGNLGAEDEIREYSCLILETLQKRYPDLFKNLTLVKSEGKMIISQM